MDRKEEIKMLYEWNLIERIQIYEDYGQVPYEFLPKEKQQRVDELYREQCALEKEFNTL